MVRKYHCLYLPKNEWYVVETNFKWTEKSEKNTCAKINPLTQLSMPSNFKLCVYKKMYLCIVENLAGQFYKLAEKSPNTYAKDRLFKKFLETQLSNSIQNVIIECHQQQYNTIYQCIVAKLCCGQQKVCNWQHRIKTLTENWVSKFFFVMISTTA